MSKEALIQLVRELTKQVGEDGLRRAVDIVTASAIVTDRESVKEQALYVLDVDYEDLRTADDTDECG